MTLSEINKKLDRIVQLVPSSNIENIRVRVLIKEHNMLNHISSFGIVKTSYFKLDDKDNLVELRPKLEYVIHCGNGQGYVGFNELHHTLNLLEKKQNSDDSISTEISAYCHTGCKSFSNCYSHIDDVVLNVDIDSGIYTVFLELGGLI